MKLEKGMVFGTANPMALGRGINVIQNFWSRDGESTYSHSGIIKNDQGDTFEALWTVKSVNLLKVYAGKNVIIAKPLVPPTIINAGLERIIKEHEGQFYPFWRLGMHIIPPLAKIALFDRLVCSEIVAQYEYYIGARHEQYKGTSPDTLADEWVNWKNFEIVFQGILKEDSFI